jgi:hypothetical protein
VSGARLGGGRRSVPVGPAVCVWAGVCVWGGGECAWGSCCGCMRQGRGEAGRGGCLLRVES